MINTYSIEKILFLDIETVPINDCYEKLDDKFKYLWDKKANRISTSEDETSSSLYNRAGIYSEFGKIICISVAFFHKQQLRVKSYYNDDEIILLTEFKELLDKHFNTSSHLLCGHNSKEFDFPFIARRMLINKIKIPKILTLFGKRPWEVNHLDTMHLWRFGDYKNYTSLDLLTTVFKIPTPKDDIDGSEVCKIYWQNHDLERIRKYCEKDTISVVRLFQCFRGEDFVKDEMIVIAD